MRNSDNSKPESRLGIHAYLVAAAAAVVGTYSAALATIRTRFYRDVRISSWLQGNTKTNVTQYKTDLDNIANQFYDGKISAIDWMKQQGQRKRDFKIAIDEVLSKRGHPINGLEGYTTGLFQRYQSMSPHVQQQVKINSAITATVAAAGVLGFFTNRMNKKRMESMDKKLDDISASLVER